MKHFESYVAQTKEKDDNIVLKIAKNGSYTLNNLNNMKDGTSLLVIVDVTPCPKCAENTPRRIPRQLSLNDTLIAALSDRTATKEHHTTNRPFLNHPDLHSLSSQIPVSLSKHITAACALIICIVYVHTDKV